MSIDNISNKTVTAKVATAFVVGAMTIAVAFAFTAPKAHAALTESQISSILSLLNSFGADAATVDNVETSLRGGTPSGGGGTTGGTGFTFTQNLTLGDTGNEVMELQKFLNSDPSTQLGTAPDAGSPGNETSYFGPRTKAAVIKFQNKYTASVLAPVGLSTGTGFWGPSSRAHANAMSPSSGDTGGDTGDTGGDTGGTVGTGLTVSGTSQPSNSLAPDNASRVPFTKFVVTASNDGDVVMDSVVVERVGLGANAAFSGVILLDENGVQLGNEKTLNSNNQATVGEKVTVKAGTSKAFTIAANMPSDNSTRDGQQLTLQVRAINTSATVSGSLPITGATHTVNASLSIGTATAARGANDPNSARTPEVGTTGHIFSGVKLTAGSAEDMRLMSIRWDQSGSASADDLGNVKVVAGGTEYATVLSDDGDHYTATFGSGILVEEGLSIEIYIKGDIVNGSSRTVFFDIEDATDIHLVGETFGYGITPTATTAAEFETTSTFSTDGDPFFDSSRATIGTGSLVVSSTNDVPAGNIANGATDVPLGSFKFDVKGEAVTWSSIVITVSTSSGGSGTSGNKALTNITLADANGAVLSGPQDPTAAGSAATLSDSVTLQPGENILVVRGNLDNDWASDDTIQIQITSTNISSLKGDTSGTTITPTPSAAVSGKTQTVSAGGLTVSPSSSLVSQNIIDSSSSVLLGEFILDGTGSGEDLKITTAQIRAITGTTADVDELNSLQLFVDGVALNTGSNAVNPSGNADDDDVNLTFTLDSGGYVVPKGTTKTLSLRGNVSATSPDANTTYRFDFSAGSPDWSVTGVTTGQDVSETLTTGSAATLTVVGAGTLTAALDAADPVERWYVANTTATIGIFNFASKNEDLEITDFDLQIDGVSTTAAGIAKLELFDGSTSAVVVNNPPFTNNRHSFDFTTGAFVVSADDDKTLTVKATFPEVGVNKAGTSGQLIKVGTTTVAANNKARGLDSGSSVEILGSAGTTTGARYFKTLPTLAVGSVPTSQLGNGTKEIYRFSVTADAAGEVGIYKFSFNIATTGVTTTDIKLTEVETGKIVKSSMNTVDSNGNLTVVVDSSAYGSAVITVPSNTTRTYKLEGTVGSSSDGDTIQTELLGDSAVAGLATNAGNASNVAATTQGDFVWSPISTTTSAGVNNFDWFNGFRVPGLEFDDLGIITLTDPS